jgi:hypothetical protein
MSRRRLLKRTSTLALRQRKARLVRSFKPPPHLLHASLLERFLKCGKGSCQCHSGGPKHGPFFYLNRCFAKGQLQSLLLKSQEQVEQARQSLAAYTQAQEVLDEISQINYELLRRGESLGGTER